MGPLGTEALELGAVMLAAALAWRALRVAPLATLAVAALAGLLAAQGVLAAPDTRLAQRVDAAQGSVERWQDRRGREISCELRTFRALTGEDEAALPEVAAACERAGRPPR